MPDQHLFAIIDVFGACWVINDGGTEKVAGLSSLVRQGWKPVRETPFIAANSAAYILILFERT